MATKSSFSGLVWAGLLRWGYDPLWSVSKALKYCYDPVHVKVDTQPYFIMARFTGSAFGLGMKNIIFINVVASFSQYFISRIRLERTVTLRSIHLIAFHDYGTNLISNHNVSTYLSTPSFRSWFVVGAE